jgi:diguanylate cyclase (GGDEF)-like protein
MREAHGAWRPVEAIGVNLPGEPGVGGEAHYIRDAARRKEGEERLVRRAFYDPLTGLASRALFLDRLSHALSGAARRGNPVAVLLLDLDDFGEVEANFGPGAGNVVLTVVGRRLEATLRPGDTLARLGADEFAVLLGDAADAPGAALVAGRISAALAEPVSWSGHTLFVTASLGVASSGPGLGTAEDLLRAAGAAMGQAKRSGKARYAVSEEGVPAEGLRRLRLEGDLRRVAADPARELSLCYQPEVALGTGNIFAVEALLRWEHPERGGIPPEAFVGLLEETGLIVPVGRWVLREACRQASLWRRQAPGRPPAVGVNLSARQLLQPALVEAVAGALREARLEPAGLLLEVTESSLVSNPEQAAETLGRLKELGVGLALDDFGTGYSSLSHLERFPVDFVKIDKSFVDRPGSEERGRRRLVPQLVGLAHALGIEAVAEGVETAEQLEELRVAGCDAAQGYYLSRPLPGSEVAALLESGLTGRITRL